MDPLQTLVMQMTQVLVDQREDHHRHVGQLIQHIGDQNQLLRELLDQYVNRGSNNSESLNSRLERTEQYLKEPEWEPIGNPFEGM